MRLIFVLLLAAISAFAASLDCSLEPQSARIGEELIYRIRINGADGKAVRILWPEESEFQLLNMDSAEYAKSGAFTFHVAVYDTGVRTLAGIPVVIGSGAAAETLSTQALQVTIESSLPDSANALKANKGYREHPFRLRELLEYWWIGAILAVAAIGYWVWRKYFRKVPLHEQLREPELSPHDQAIRDLLLLRDQRYPARGMLKEFYSDYSHIMRYYLERRYSFPALEMTTFDLEYELDDSRYLSDFCTRLLPGLRQADLVKFAKYLPSPAECEQWIELGFELVTKSKPAEIAMPAKSEADKPQEVTA